MGRPAARLKKTRCVGVDAVTGLRHDYPSLRTTQGIQMARWVRGGRNANAERRAPERFAVDALIELPSCPCVASATPVDGLPARGTTIGPRLGALDNLGTL